MSEEIAKAKEFIVKVGARDVSGLGASTADVKVLAVLDSGDRIDISAAIHAIEMTTEPAQSPTSNGLVVLSLKTSLFFTDTK